LTLASGWWSSKTAAVELSIVTGLTVSRLDQLEAQCRAWQGSLVASVYLVLHIPPGSTGLGEENTALLEEAAAQMEELHAK
jgi:glycosyltransferase-like protein LARGE